MGRGQALLKEVEQMRLKKIDRSQLKDYVATFVGGACSVLTVVFLSLFDNPCGIEAVQYVGLAFFAAAGVLFVLHAHNLVLPRRRKGWGYAAVLVDTGLYGVVRHPLYLGVILFFCGGILVGQHWAVAVVAVAGLVTMYWSMLLEERSSIEKFGDDYKRYMQRVPRMNIILGVIRLLRSRKVQ